MRRALARIALVVLAVAIVASIAWQQVYSNEARIEHAYATCMSQFGGAARAPAAAPATEAGVPGATMAESLGKAMTDLAKGVTAGMSAAVCGAVRDACRADFDGAVCQNALAGFR
ncbi:hypothetical protein BURK1_00658 [Burkholderiales bacterium]|nr:hypothetical protein BURK1_00658 [Burkholderiales bacterium]